LTGNARARIDVRDLLLRSPQLEDYAIEGAITLEHSMVRKLGVDRGELVATLANSTLNLTRMVMSGPAIDVNGSGIVEFDGLRSSQVDYEIPRADLALLREAIGRDVSGELATKGRLTGPTTKLRAIGDGTLTRLDAMGIKALTTTAQYDATVPPDAPNLTSATITGRASFIEAFGQRIQEVAGSVAYDNNHATLDLQLVPREGIAGKVAGSFVIDPEDRAIDLTTLTMTFRRGTWRLVQPGRPRVSWDDLGVSVQSLTLADPTDTQRISVDGTWRSAGGGALTITARRVFLDAFAPDDQQPVRYGGVLDLDATLSGTSNLPIVTGQLTITDGRVRRLSYQKLAGRVGLNDGILQIDLRLDQAPGVWLTAAGTLPMGLFDPALPDRPMNVAITSSSISLGLLEGVTDIVKEVSGELSVNVTAVGTSRDPHLDGTINLSGAAFLVAASGARYRNGRAALRLSLDRLTVESLHVEDRDGNPLDVRGSLGTHELRVGALEIDATARGFEVLRNEFGRIDIDADLTLRGRLESPRVDGQITIASGEVRVDPIMDRTLFQPYSTRPASTPDMDAIAALNPWERLGLGLELHVPNTLRMVGENVQITPGTPIGFGSINLRALGDLYLYKDPGQPLYVTGSFDQVTGTYVFQGRRFDLDPTSSINFHGDLNPELFVTVTREISGVQTRVTIAGPLREPELRLASTPPLDPSDILSLIVFNTSTNELSALQQEQLVVRAGTLAAAFLAAPILGALERTLGLSMFEIEPSADIRGGTRVTIADEIAPGLVARFSRQFGQYEYDEATIEYYLSRIFRIRATFSDADTLIRSPFRRVERAGIDLLMFFSF
jgi:hypothetical protein